MHVVPSVARNGDSSPLDRMLVLAMAAARANLSPPIFLDCTYQVADFHQWRLLLRNCLATSANYRPAGICFNNCSASSLAAGSALPAALRRCSAAPATSPRAASAAPRL